MRRARPGLIGEQFRGANFALTREFGAHRLRAVAGLRTFEIIAALVLRETVGIGALVFQRLAERERQMDPVHEGKIGAPGLLLHACDLGIIEAIGLEIGQRVPGIAMVGLGRNGRLDSLQWHRPVRPWS